MRKKLICPDCGYANYSVESFCKKCSARLEKAKAKTNASSFVEPKALNLLDISKISKNY